MLYNNKSLVLIWETLQTNLIFERPVTLKGVLCRKNVMLPYRWIKNGSLKKCHLFFKIKKHKKVGKLNSARFHSNLNDFMITSNILFVNIILKTSIREGS